MGANTAWPREKGFDRRIGYAVCRLKNFPMLYWIMDANDMRYVNCTYVRTHAQAKFSIEHTSVGLAHTRPIIELSQNLFISD